MLMSQEVFKKTSRFLYHGFYTHPEVADAARIRFESASAPSGRIALEIEAAQEVARETSLYMRSIGPDRSTPFGSVATGNTLGRALQRPWYQ